MSETPIDFGVVREPMYKYSKMAQDRFLQMPEFAFMFVHFAKSAEGQKFAMTKFAENKDKDFAPRMSVEIDCLCKEAQENLMANNSATAKTMKDYMLKFWLKHGKIYEL